METTVRSGHQVTRSNSGLHDSKCPEGEQTRSRFVVLRHDVGSQLIRTTETHYDWMFEVDGVLRTWATQPIHGFDQSIEQECDSLSNHRLDYLDYEGEIQGDRGNVIRLLQGTYRLNEIDDDRFSATLFWRQDANAHEADITFYRSLPGEGLRREDNCDCWRFRFSPGRYETNR